MCKFRDLRFVICDFWFVFFHVLHDFVNRFLLLVSCDFCGMWFSHVLYLAICDVCFVLFFSRLLWFVILWVLSCDFNLYYVIFSHISTFFFSSKIWVMTLFTFFPISSCWTSLEFSTAGWGCSPCSLIWENMIERAQLSWQNGCDGEFWDCREDKVVQAWSKSIHSDMLQLMSLYSNRGKDVRGATVWNHPPRPSDPASYLKLSYMSTTDT